MAQPLFHSGDGESLLEVPLSRQVPQILDAKVMAEAEETPRVELPSLVFEQDIQDAAHSDEPVNHQPSSSRTEDSSITSELSLSIEQPRPSANHQYRQTDRLHPPRQREKLLEDRQANTSLNHVWIAMLVAMLPALTVGTATYVFGQKILDQSLVQAKQSGQSGVFEVEQRNERYSELLRLLLFGTGAIALFFGGLAAFWAYRMMRSAMMQGAMTAKRDGQQLYLQESRALTDAISQIHRAKDEPSIFEAAVNGLRDVLHCDRVVLYHFNNGSGGVVQAESVELGLSKAMGTTLEDPYFLASQVEANRSKARAIRDIRDTEMLSMDIAQLEMLQVKSVVGAILHQAQEPFGALVAQSCHQHRNWLPSEIALLEHLASEVGFALENAQRANERDLLEQRLVLETQWKAYFEEATHLIHHAAETPQILQTAVTETQHVLNCDRALVYSLDEQNQGVILAETVVPGYPKILGQTMMNSGFAIDDLEPYREGQVRVIDHLNEADLPPGDVERLAQLDVKAMLVAPIFYEGKLHRLLVVHHFNTPRHWHDLEVRWFKQIALQIGYALENATFKQWTEQMGQTASDQTSRLPQTVIESWQQAQAMASNLTLGVTHQREQVATLTAQLQTVADATRLMAGKVQQAEQELPNVEHIVHEGHEHVNQMIDVLSDLQETVAGYANQSHYLGASAQGISQLMQHIHQLAEQVGQQSIHLSIIAGQSRENIQTSVGAVAETVLEASQQIMAATAKLAPLTTQLETESQTMMQAMEVGTEQVIVGTELVKETRYKLNQLTQYGDRLNQLLQRIIETSPTQSQSLTSITQHMQDMTSLINQILEQASDLSEHLHPPNQDY